MEAGIDLQCRCPKQLDCIWPGPAAAEVVIAASCVHLPGCRRIQFDCKLDRTLACFEARRSAAFVSLARRLSSAAAAFLSSESLAAFFACMGGTQQPCQAPGLRHAAACSKEGVQQANAPGDSAHHSCAGLEQIARWDRLLQGTLQVPRLCLTHGRLASVRAATLPQRPMQRREILRAPAALSVLACRREASCPYSVTIPSCSCGLSTLGQYERDSANRFVLAHETKAVTRRCMAALCARDPSHTS